MSELPIPNHFDGARTDEVWRVEYGVRAPEAEEWAAEHGIGHPSDDDPRIALLLVDCQNTFCIPGYELFVAGRSGRGAVDDNNRLCQFIYRNLHRVSEITATLDTHTALQIFHPVFWVNEEGDHPVGGQTEITLADVEEGRWCPNPAVADSLAGGDVEWLRAYARHYVRRVTEGRYPLMVWPYHSMLGSVGHALVSALDEAVFFHSIARQTAARFEVKGGTPLTENYSVFSPEVIKGPEGEPIASPNLELFGHLMDFDALIVAGQAASHCVAWTLHDLLTAIQARDPDLAGKVYILEDCMSSVVVPRGPDFTEEAEEALDLFEENGMRRVRSTDPMSSWEGMA
ncbi:MAG: cysteine hydrolase family protein, partial [marine benthic group bacterium]|nr:cysteine hydrolase family protein [Candidatus Benthicola marisminoris]